MKAFGEESGNTLVRLVDIVDCDNGKVAVVTEVSEGCSRAGFQACFVDGYLGYVEAYWHAPETAICQADIRDDSTLVLAGQPQPRASM